MKNIREQINCHNCLSDCTALKVLSSEELDELNLIKRHITYKKGETVLKQNTFLSHIVFIKNGLIKIFTEGTNEKNVIIKFAGENEFIGLSFLYNKNYLFYTATALKKTELCLIEKQKFTDLILKNTGLHEIIINIISNESELLYSKLTVFGTKQLHGRLATAILNLCELSQKKEKIFPHITKKEIAEYSGMSPESLMRLMNELKSDKIIITKGKEIIINDYDLLVKLSQIG